METFDLLSRLLVFSLPPVSSFRPLLSKTLSEPPIFSHHLSRNALFCASRRHPAKVCADPAACGLSTETIRSRARGKESSFIKAARFIFPKQKKQELF